MQPLYRIVSFMNTGVEGPDIPQFFGSVNNFIGILKFRERTTIAMSLETSQPKGWAWTWQNCARIVVSLCLKTQNAEINAGLFIIYEWRTESPSDILPRVLQGHSWIPSAGHWEFPPLPRGRLGIWKLNRVLSNCHEIWHIHESIAVWRFVCLRGVKNPSDALLFNFPSIGH